MRIARKLLAISGGLMLAIPAGSAVGTTSSAEEPAFQTGDIEHVANIPFGGSDIEFATREVTKLSNGATGDPVCQKDASGACQVDAAGNVIYETEVRDFAVAGGYPSSSGGARIIDITDPRNPVVAGITPCAISQNDIQIQGDLLLVASDGNGTCKKPDGGNQPFAGTALLNFSDPRSPTYISHLQYSRGSHNHTFVPGKPIVYLSDSDVANAALGNIPIWDISDPANPVMKFEFKFGAHSPHDITFNADGTRAYVAAVSLTYILNTENPINPTLVSVIPNEGVSISHQADPTPDGDYLLVSDELGGGAAGVSPGGPIHVYDIRNEARPVKVGIIENDCVQQTCQSAPDVPVATSHVFRINPDGYTMAIAWYKDGLGVVDFSSIRGANVAGTGTTSKFGARVIGWITMPNANTWSAKMWMERHPGYVFTNDIRRGFDVFYVASMGPGYLARGTIDGGHPANFSQDNGVTRQEFTSDCEYTPQTNGVDGWVTKIPAGLADGKNTLHAKAIGGSPAPYDLDIYFFDKDCVLVGAEEPADTDTMGLIPEGTEYAMVTNYAPGPPISLDLSTQFTP
ncbi:MAG: LVIVD repeat-containing protein [Actinomycetota bacterium]